VSVNCSLGCVPCRDSILQLAMLLNATMCSVPVLEMDWGSTNTGDLTTRHWHRSFRAKPANRLFTRAYSDGVLNVIPCVKRDFFSLKRAARGARHSARSTKCESTGSVAHAANTPCSVHNISVELSGGHDREIDVGVADDIDEVCPGVERGVEHDLNHLTVIIARRF
jgi:hypothetical protein